MPKTVQANLQFSWERDFVELTSDLVANPDSIHLFMEAPRRHLEDISGEIFVLVDNPRIWSPKPFPANIPSIGKIKVRSKVQGNLLTKSLAWQSELDLALGAISILPQGLLTGTVDGSLGGQLGTHLQWKGPQSESVEADVEVDPDLAVRGSGSVRGLSIQIGPRLMPIEGEIHRFERRGDRLEIDASTITGSHVSLDVVNLKDPQVSIQAQIAPTEPWALTWTNGNLQLAPPSVIEGDFHRGILTANVRTAVPYAYKVTAESFETDLTLSSKGVYFDNGNFISRGMEHFFDGEVVWDSTQQHYQFEIRQASGGVAKVFGDFNGHLSLAVSKLPTLKLPLADTSVLRGVDALVTGNWEQHFADRNGVLRLALETVYKSMPIDFFIRARQNQDSLMLESLEAEASGNHLRGSAIFLNDTLPETPLIFDSAYISAEKFSLPALLTNLGDSSLENADLEGEFRWSRASGLGGKLDISEIRLRNISPDMLRVQRLQLIGEKDQLQASARLHLGKNGFWDSEAEINIKDVFSPNRGFAAALVSDNGGVVWLEGILDSAKVWTGKLHIEGPWLIPGGMGEVRRTRFDADLRADLLKGLAGISGSFLLDTALLSSPKFDIPFAMSGRIDSLNLQIDSLFIYGEDNTRITTSATFDLTKKSLSALNFGSPEFHLRFDRIHKIVLSALQGEANQHVDGTLLSIRIPKISYDMVNKDLGEAHGRFNSNLSILMPKKNRSDQAQQSTRIGGRVEIEQLNYSKKLDIVPDWDWFKSTMANASKAFSSFSKETPKPVGQKSARGASVSTSTPTELNLEISDGGKDSLWISTSLAQFPFTLNLQIQGTTDEPLISGDINSVGRGFIGLEKFSTFDLQSLRVWWQDAPVRKGQIDVMATKDVPYCPDSEQERDETCPVNLSISGSLTKPSPIPSANCGVESSPAQIYYSVFLLGCFSNNPSGPIDRNKLLGKALGMGVSQGINKSLGGDYVGDIGLKYRFLNETTTDNRDSNYIRVPLKLDRWVKNLSLVVGYTQDQSATNAQYNQSESYELGLKYSMPVLDSNEYLPNHINPSLDFFGNLVERRSPSSLDGATSDNRLEKNIGTHYSWKFWDYCLFGFGLCPAPDSTTIPEAK